MSKLNLLIWGTVALLAVVWLLSLAATEKPSDVEKSPILEKTEAPSEEEKQKISKVPWGKVIIRVLVLGGLGIIVLYLFLVCGAFLEEGTGRLALKFGAYDKTLIAKTGFVIDADGTIREKEEDKEERHLLGGWRWVGLWPIYKVFVKDKFLWAKIKPDGTIEEKKEENVSEFLVRYYVYGLECKDAEDKNLVPTNSFWSVTAWTSNLKRAWLDTDDWFGTFRNRVLPYIRHHVTLHTYEDIIAKDDVRLGDEVWKTLKKEEIFKELEDKHGIKIVAMECVDFSPDEDYRKATLKKWKAERLREERIGSTSGTLIRMLADQIGITEEEDFKEFQAELRANPKETLEKYRALVEINKDFIDQLVASDASAGSALRRYYFTGGTGGMDVIALLGDVLRGTSGVKPGAQESKPAKGKKGTKKTEEEDDEGEEEEEDILGQTVE